MKPYHRRKHTIKNNGKKTRSRHSMRRNKKGGAPELVPASSGIRDRIRKMWVDATQHHDDHGREIAVSYVSDHLVWYTRHKISLLTDTWRTMIKDGIVSVSTVDNLLDNINSEWVGLFITPNDPAEQQQLDLAALYVFNEEILGQCFFFKRDIFFRYITSLKPAIRKEQIAWARTDIPNLVRRTQPLYRGMAPRNIRQLTMQTMANYVFGRLTHNDPNRFNRTQKLNPLALTASRRSKTGLMVRAFSMKYELMHNFGVAMVGGRPGRPCYVAVDPTTNNIAVNNAGTGDIQIFNSQGGIINTINVAINIIYMIFNSTGNLIFLDDPQYDPQRRQYIHILNLTDTSVRSFGISLPFSKRASSFTLNTNETEIVVHFGLLGLIRILKMDGTFLRDINTVSLPTISQLRGEGTIVIDRDGNIVLTDANNRRIQVYNYFSGDNVRTIDMASMKRPFWLAIDPSSGNFAVADSPPVYEEPPKIPIRVIRGDGSLVCTVGNRQLVNTQGITFAPNGDLVVCDTGNGRIKIFSRV